MTFFADCIIWTSAYAALRFFFFVFVIPYDSLPAIAADIFYWAALFLHLQKKHSLPECGICVPSRPRFRSAAALLLIPTFLCFLYGFPGVYLRKLLAILLAALAEEMAFRVLLPKLLSEQTHISVISSALFSSTIFALFHGAACCASTSLPVVLLQMLYAFCAGCAFCALLQKTKSVLPPVVLHALINWSAGNQSMRLYIDPGTGSMLFVILIGLFGAVNWMLKGFVVNARFILSGGKHKKGDSKKIPLVIFSDDKRYWSVFEPVCRELDARGFDAVYMTASPDDPVLKSNYEHIHPEFIGEGNKAFAKLNFLSASVVFSTTPGLNVYQWKRSENVDFYVHMLHAAAEVVGYRMFGLDYYDAVMLSGDYQLRDERNLEKLRNLPAKELVMVGVPYMDEMAKRLAANPLPPYRTAKKTILLAPSWGKSAIFSRFGGDILDVLLKTDYHIIVRPHMQSFTSEKELMERLMTKYPDSDRLEWNRDADNFEVLKRSDLLISDFSGVIFDFSLVYDKPVIYADTEFDNSLYDACWLDTPFWTFTALPRIGEKLTADRLEQLPELISACLSEQRYADGRKQVRDETWCFRGEGAVRAADYLIVKCRELSNTEGKKEN